MTNKVDLNKMVDGYLAGTYKTTEPRGVPNPADIPLGNQAAKLGATALFIDLRQSSDITNAFRRKPPPRCSRATSTGPFASSTRTRVKSAASMATACLRSS